MAGSDVVEDRGFQLHQLLLEKREVFNSRVEDLDSSHVVLDGVTILTNFELVSSSGFLDLALLNDLVYLWLLLLLLLFVSI